MKKTKLSELKPDPKNANKHSEFGMRLLEKSITELGAGRSILISNDNVIIAGNGVTEAAAAQGLENVIVVESNGKELIAIRRTDITSGTKEFYNMALADNIVSEKNIVLDANVVEAIIEEVPETKVWGSLALPDGEGPLNRDRADGVEMKFLFSSKQYAEVKKAMKLAKQKFHDQFNPNENENEQGNTLFFVMREFLKNNK